MERGHEEFASEKMSDCLCQVTLGLTPVGSEQCGKSGQYGKSEACGLQHCSAQVLLASFLHDKRVRNKEGDHLLKLMPSSGSVAMI